MQHPVLDATAGTCLSVGTHSWRRVLGRGLRGYPEEAPPLSSLPQDLARGRGGSKSGQRAGPGPARGVSDANLAPAAQSAAEGDPWAVVVGAGGPAWPGVSAPYKDFKSAQPGQCGRDQEVVPRAPPGPLGGCPPLSRSPLLGTGCSWGGGWRGIQGAGRRREGLVCGSLESVS